MIILEHVSKVFPAQGDNVHAVNDVSLTIEDGQIFGIVGFSGAGKSTLVRLINMLETPTSGKVVVNGVELSSLKGRKLDKERRKIGMIFQQFNLFATRTVLENVAYPLKGTGMSRANIQEKAERLLKYVGLLEKRDAYPSQLSGGQKQRVAIARAIACDPQVLLCDEATSALDPQTTTSILRLLKQLNHETGITIVIITHQMNVVKEICDRVAVMENGHVVETGSVFDVFAEPQEEVTRSFVNTTNNLSRVDELLAENSPVTRLKPGEVMCRLKYLRSTSGEALVSQLSRKYYVDMNIIFGSVEVIGDSPIGGLVVIMSGESASIDAVIAQMSSLGVEVEVVSDARIA